MLLCVICLDEFMTLELLTQVELKQQLRSHLNTYQLFQIIYLYRVLLNEEFNEEMYEKQLLYRQNDKETLEMVELR